MPSKIPQHAKVKISRALAYYIFSEAMKKAEEHNVSPFAVLNSNCRDRRAVEARRTMINQSAPWILRSVDRREYILSNERAERGGRWESVTCQSLAHVMGVDRTTILRTWRPDDENPSKPTKTQENQRSCESR